MTLIQTLTFILIIFVIFTFFRSKSMWTPSNVFIFDLALSDLLICILGFPFLTISGFCKEWIFSEAGCSAYAFSMSVTGMHSIFILTILAVERLKVISRPLKMVKIVSKKRSFLLVLISWTFAIFVSIPPLLGWNRYVLEGLHISCSYDMFDGSWRSKSYIVFLIGIFLVVLLIIIFCYLALFLKVQRQATSMRVMIKDSRDLLAERERQRENKLIWMGCNITLAFVLSWGPYALVTILSIFKVLNEKNSLIIVTFPSFFAKSFTIYNPIIYIFSYPKFKKELSKLLLLTNKRKLAERFLQKTIFSATRGSIPNSAFNINSEGVNIIGEAGHVDDESGGNQSEIWEVRIKNDNRAISSFIEMITKL
nr:non-canonical R-opsin 2 [Schmidtea mediterranea]